MALIQVAVRKLDGAAPSLSHFDSLMLGVKSQVLRKFFGSWSKALQAAGVKPRRTWKEARTREECFQNLRSLWDHLKRQPRYDELNRSPSQIGAKTYERIWGTYTKALAAYRNWLMQKAQDNTSIELRPETMTRLMDDAALKDELRRISQLAGTATITQEHVNQHSRICVRTFRRRFGSWEEAVKQAGLQLSVYANRYDDDELFNNLMAVWEALGHSPKAIDMETHPSSIPSTAYVARFGTWRKGLMAFLKWVENEETEPSIIAPELSDPGIKEMLGREEKLNKIQEDKKQALRLPPGQRDRLRAAGPKLRFLVMKRDKHRCCLCGRSQSEEVVIEIDHIIPWSDGGRTIFENLQTLCSLCNKGKGNVLDKDNV